MAAEKQHALWNFEFDTYDYLKMGIDPAELLVPEAKDRTGQNVSFEEFISDYSKTRNRGRKKPLSHRTLKSQDSIINGYLIPFFGKLTLQSITTEKVDEFIDQLVSEYHPMARVRNEDDQPGQLKPKTINNFLASLSAVLTMAKKKGRIDTVPQIDWLPSEPDENIDVLTTDDAKRLIAAGHGLYGRIVQTFLLTGMRAMELSGLKWEDYDPVKGQLRVARQYCPYDGGPKFRQPKWGSQRVLPVAPRLAAVLSEQKASTRLMDGLVFLSQAGNPVAHELMRNGIYRICRRAEIRRIGPQVLRRTFATELCKSKRHPKEVQQMLGQTNAPSTVAAVLTGLKERYFDAFFYNILAFYSQVIHVLG